MKKCQRCGKVQSFDNFYSRTDRAGYFAWCIHCMAREGRERFTVYSQLQYEKGYLR